MAAKMELTGLKREQVVAAMEYLHKESALNLHLRVAKRTAAYARETLISLNTATAERDAAKAEIERLVPDYADRLL